MYEYCREQEEQIRDYIGGDPLSPWISYAALFFELWSRYIKWTQENCPTDTKAYLSVIERCLQKFTESPLYSQDIRFLRIWILYVNSLDFQMAKQTFAFMRTHNIGGTLALFYLAETLVYEQNGEYEQTERLYQEGITLFFLNCSIDRIGVRSPLNRSAVISTNSTDACDESALICVLSSKRTDPRWILYSLQSNATG